MPVPLDRLIEPDEFTRRHVGPSPDDVAQRLATIGVATAQELLEQGLPQEALKHMQECISEYDLCPRAWATQAATHKRLGHKVEAAKCEERATKLERILLDRPVECDIRENHVLFRSIFGISDSDTS